MEEEIKKQGAPEVSELLPTEAPAPKEPAPEPSAPQQKHEWDEPFEAGGFLTMQPDAPAQPDNAQAPAQKKGLRLKRKKRKISWPAPKKESAEPLPEAPAQTPEDPTQPLSPEQLKNARIVRLAQVRRRRNARRMRVLILCAVVVAVVIAFAAGAFNSSLAAIGDFADTVRIGVTPGGGYPVKTNIDEIYQVEELAGGFVELGKQDLLLYSASGARLRSIQHNYARPALAVGNTRFCVYSRSGNELRVESRSQTLYTKTTENPLLLCAMSSNNNLAVVTRSTRYAAELTVYNSNMAYLYGWNPGGKDGTPARVSFSADNKRLAVACVRAVEGELNTTMYFLNIDSSQVTVCEESENSLPLQVRWLDSNQVLVVYQDAAVVYNPHTGAQKYRADFGSENLISADASGKNTVLLFSGGNSLLQGHLVVLSDQLKTLADAWVNGDVSRVVCTRTDAYVLKKNEVSCFALDGEEKWSLATDAEPQTIVNAKELLLFSGSTAQVLTPPAS